MQQKKEIKIILEAINNNVKTGALSYSFNETLIASQKVNRRVEDIIGTDRRSRARFLLINGFEFRRTVGKSNSSFPVSSQKPHSFKPKAELSAELRRSHE